MLKVSEIMDNRFGWIKYFCPSNKTTILIISNQLSSKALISTFFSSGCAYRVIDKYHYLSNPINEREEVVALIYSRLPISAIRNFFSRQGYEIFDAYFAIPSFYNPKWFMPLVKRYIGVRSNIIKPTRFNSIIKWKLLIFFYRVGLLQFIIPSKLIMFRKRKNRISTTSRILEEYLKTKFKSHELRFTIYTGVRGYYQKFTIQIMNKKGDVIGYGKIAHSLQTKERLYNEANRLKYLETIKFSFLEIPRLVSIENLPGTEDIIMLTTPAPLCYNRVYKKLTEKHVNALAELFIKTNKLQIAAKDILNRFQDSTSDFEKDARKTEEFKGIFTILKESFKKLQSILINIKITTAISHGDFSPWNVYGDRTKLFIFDWEMAKFKPPLWDIFNFIITSEAQIFSKNPKDILKNIFDNSSAYKNLSDKYSFALGGDVYCNKKILFALYLIDAVLFYGGYFNNQTKLNNAYGDTAKKNLIMTSFMLKSTFDSLQKYDIY